MVWISLVASVVSQRPWKDTYGRSPTVRTTDTLKVCSCSESFEGISRPLQSGMTSVHCISGPCFLTESTLSMEASHAKTFPWQAAEQAWKDSEVGYTSRSLASSGKFDPDSCSWKTSQLSLLEAGSESLQNFPPYGMTVDGVFYPLRTWERITDAIDGGSWPTPRAEERGQYQRDGGKKGKERATLTGRVKMWRTPLSSDADKKGHGNLSHQVKMWPTPTACAGQQPGEHGQGGQNLATVAGGSLNPMWVEWLMGYPSGWTVLEDWATQWFRPKCVKRLKG